MISRRQFNQLVATLAISSTLPIQSLAESELPIKKVILKSEENISAIGMGTWITFDQKKSVTDPSNFISILNEFFRQGGQMIDSSPMYGYAQQFLGSLLPNVNNKNLFSATKVWIPGQKAGIQQMHKSAELWGLDKFDLMHIHNMLDWKKHLQTLNQWKQNGKLRYTGITTSHGRRHQELIDMLKSNPIDFVQFSYNIMDRQAQDYLLPMAQDLGLAVVINRPFQTGGLFNLVKNKALPSFANEIGCQTWSQFFLKFIISHPAVTCVIPATSQVTHMQENMQAGFGNLPDQKMRNEMITYFESVT